MNSAFHPRRMEGMKRFAGSSNLLESWNMLTQRSLSSAREWFRGSAHFREVFREFASQKGGTVFMSSHIMSEVESLCTSVAIIHGGRILYHGKVVDVIQKVLGYSVIYLEAQGLTEQTIGKIREMA